MEKKKYIITANSEKGPIICQMTVKDFDGNQCEYKLKLLFGPKVMHGEISGDEFKFGWKFGGRIELFNKGQLIFCLSDIISITQIPA